MSTWCPQACPDGTVCQPLTSTDCARTCEAGPAGCADGSASNPFANWCDDSTPPAVCRTDGCQTWAGGFQTPGCPNGTLCVEIPGLHRYCACSGGCPADHQCTDFGPRGAWCADPRCTPACGAKELCDPAANKCRPRCGSAPDAPACGAGQVCVYLSASGYTCTPDCSPPCPNGVCSARGARGAGGAGASAEGPTAPRARVCAGMGALGACGCGLGSYGGITSRFSCLWPRDQALLDAVSETPWGQARVGRGAAPGPCHPGQPSTCTSLRVRRPGALPGLAGRVYRTSG